MAHSGHEDTMDTPSADLVAMLAVIYHDSGRASVAAGDTMAHAVDPAKVRPFVEWPDLPLEAGLGRELTARRLLERFHVGGVRPDLGGGETVDTLAPAIHEAERAAVDQGLVLVKLNRPWCGFDDLPEPAKAGRRRQALYLLDRMFIVARQQ